jgi:cell division protein FtsN
MQLFEDLDILSFVRITPLDWIGLVILIEWIVKEKCQVLKNNPQGSRLRGRPENRWWKIYNNISFD